MGRDGGSRGGYSGRGSRDGGSRGGYSGRDSGGGGQSRGADYSRGGGQSRGGYRRNDGDTNQGGGRVGGYRGHPRDGDSRSRSGGYGGRSREEGASGRPGGYRGRSSERDDRSQSSEGYRGRPRDGEGQPRQRREPRTYREPRDQREYREPREGRGRSEGSDQRTRGRYPDSARRSSDRPREQREYREPREYRERGEPREKHESRELREPREYREPREGRRTGGGRHHEAREPRAPRPRTDLPIDDDVEFRQLPKEARQALRGLSKDHGEDVGKLLIMSGRLLDYQPEVAYTYAQEALRRAGRIDVVREAAGIAAYVTERYAEALRELRTVRRLTGSNEHLPLMADAERGLGRPEKALELANSPDADSLGTLGKVELAIVASGARADLGEFDAALATLDRIPPVEGDTALRVLMARSAVLQAAGRDREARALLNDFDADDLDRAAGLLPDEVVVYDAMIPEEELPSDDEAPDGETQADESLASAALEVGAQVDQAHANE